MANKKSTALQKKSKAIKSRLTIVYSGLKSLPDPEKAKRLSLLGSNVIGNITRTGNPMWVLKKSFEWKQNLLKAAFVDLPAPQDARRLGVYVKRSTDSKDQWDIEIIGSVESTIQQLPLSDTMLEELFGLDPHYQDVEAELKKIKAAITNFASHLSDTALPARHFFPPGHRPAE